METSPVTCRTLEIFYHINAKTFDKQYKDILSGYRDWDQLSHADEWMLFPDNIGARLAIDETDKESVEEITLDLSDSMKRIVKYAFPNAKRVIDRLHIQKLSCDAVQEIRIKHRCDAIQRSNHKMEECKQTGRAYNPFRFTNGDTHKELLPEAVTFYSSQQTNRLRSRNKEPKSCSTNILIYYCPLNHNHICPTL